MTITEISAELAKALEDIEGKRKTLNTANAAYEKAIAAANEKLNSAAADYDNALIRVQDLKKQLDEAVGAYTPSARIR